MKFTGFWICFLISFSSFAHEYYFAFAEMEYNPQSKQLELTLIVTTHDVEHYVENLTNSTTLSLDTVQGNSLARRISEEFIKGFSVREAKEALQFSYVGHESKTNGQTEFYFSSTSFELKFPLHVRFDLLMDDFPKQQNKLTFIYLDRKEAFSFLPTQREQIIDNKQ